MPTVSMDLFSSVRIAAEFKGIYGVMNLRDHCGLSYERTRRVWVGDPSAKLKDISQVMESLGYKVCYEKIGQ